MSETDNKEAVGTLTDEELIDLIRTGSGKAFDILILRYRQTVSYLAGKYFSDSLTQDDWFQEGMIGLLYAVHTYAGTAGAEFSTYAAVCIRNRLVSCLKKATNSKNAPLNSSLSYDDVIIPPVHSPEDDYIENERYRFFTQSFFKQLSETEHKVMQCYLAGFSYAETAEKLGITEKSVDNAICRAKSKLKKAFKN